MMIGGKKRILMRHRVQTLLFLFLFVSSLVACRKFYCTFHGRGGRAVFMSYCSKADGLWRSSHLRAINATQLCEWAAVVEGEVRTRSA